MPMSDFEGTIDVLTKMRDEGNCTIMLCRTGIVRIVGNLEEIQRSLTGRLQRSVSPGDMLVLLTEVKSFCQTALYFDNQDAASAFIERSVYDDELKEINDDDTRLAARAQLRQKLDQATSLVPPATKERQQRLRTATQPSLEDLDVELVRERRDDLRGIKVEQPFLRVRFRYTDTNSTSLFPGWYWRSPWGGLNTFPCDAFELECDEVDIDVLLYRLMAAKRLLASANEDPVDQLPVAK
jgi:hypothetical protein